MWPWRRLTAGLRGGPDKGDLDAVSHTDVQPCGGLPAHVDLVVPEIGHGEGLTGSGREMVEALHRGCVHAEHIHPRLGEVGLWGCDGHALFGERRNSGNVLLVRKAVADFIRQLRIEVSLARLWSLRDTGARSERDRAPRLRLFSPHYNVHPPDVLESLNSQ